ncbi:MAG: hypothetical protein KGD58_00970 [Candidatus Lokiarchaeota archaeon]|nr:hypothetical protein [Candidatus Lokiarchaeota archaeon]
MDEHEEDEFEEDDEDGFDPTKEAFFSDLIGMEEDIASEAYERVEHALNLIKTKYYDDSIEVLRQAIGLYAQINREEEIKAINDKISEVYLLKEQAFREDEIKQDQDAEKAIVVDIPDEPLASDLQLELAQEEFIVDLLAKAVDLINDGNNLLQNNSFEEALDKYDEAIEIFESMNKPDEVDRVFKLIEECYIKKAEFLRSVKVGTSETQVEPELRETPAEGQLKDDKLTQYLSSKKKEEELSTQAYDLLGQAAELSRYKQYKEALQLYGEGRKLFQELGWEYEVKKIDETLAQLNAEHLTYVEELEKKEVGPEMEIETQKDQVDSLEQQVKEIASDVRIEKLERFRGIELQKMETEFFKAQIDNMVTEASRMAREYELAMQKAIKKGELIEDCTYPQVIEIYKKIKELLIDKGWRSEAAIYDDTINVYIQKFEQDKKIRQIEAEKVIKQKEAEDFLKVTRVEEIPALKEKGPQVSDEKFSKEIENQKIRTENEEMTNKAERLAREYEVALRKGKFELECPYPEIINIFKTARERSLERGWETDAAIYLSQVQAYTEKLGKDKKLRQIEAEKELKQKQVEDILKIQKEEKKIGIEDEKLTKITEQRQQQQEEEDFKQLINDMINKAERLAREYDTDMKTAVRRGKLGENPPFEDIIKIYERARQIGLTKGRTEDISTFDNQISYYAQQWEKDNNLREVEAQKIQKQTEIEEMHKGGRKVEIDKGRLELLEKKKEEEDFESFITDMVNKAEKLVREHEIAMRKAMRKGEILESTPYEEVIESYHQIREKVYARGWKEQAQVYANQIKIYQDKLERHIKLLEVEAQKFQREKDIEDLHKAEATTELDLSKMKRLASKKEENEFQNYILEIINNAEKLEREYDSALKKALKKGEFIEQTPYLEIIEIYRQIQNELLERGWVDQSKIYFNQIKIYQEKLKKNEILREVEAKKAKRIQDIEEMHRVKDEFKPAKSDKIKEIDTSAKEEDILLDKAMNLIDQAEKLVKNYEISIKTDVLLYESPYEKAISYYNEAKKLLQKIGWNDEAGRLINTIKFYTDKKEKDEKLREIERKKLEEPEQELLAAKTHTEKDLFEKEKKILEIEKKKKDRANIAETIFNEIHDAERMAQAYESKIREKNFDHEPPYEEILKIYREARKKFEEIGWMEESMKLLNTIQFYKDKLEKDKRLRSLEFEKVKKQEEEQLKQKKRQANAKEEQERIIKKRKESLIEREEKARDFETTKDRAFQLMDHAKNELKQNNFEKAIELYKNSEEIFIQISWQEGINMVRDSVAMIKRKQKMFEHEQQTIVDKRAEKLKIEERLEEKFMKAEELQKRQQEEKRKEFLKLQSEKQWEREISEEAYELLKQGTSLVDSKKFDEGYAKYMEARKLFNKISWKREVSRINNDLLFKLQRERKAHDVLEDIKKKRADEVKKREVLKEETEKERREYATQQKAEKRKLEKEKSERKGIKEVDRAEKLIENYKYNEGIKILIIERGKLEKSGRKDEVNRIDKLILKVKEETNVPIITLLPTDNLGSRTQVEAAYKALDRAQDSILNNRFMKVISELNESKFHLEKLNINEEIIAEIDGKIIEFQKKLGKKIEITDQEQPSDSEMLKARIAARREERRKKVLDLLKKK